jgi:ligand-binding sensor domain-containing protein
MEHFGFGSLNGIAKYEPGKQFYTLLNPAENLNDEERYKRIMCLNQQNDSTIWLGTDKGLYEYNFNTKFHNFFL